MKTTVAELLATGHPIVADGGMGTMLFNAGMPRGQAPERWNIERPEIVRGIHAAYIQSGAQIILTNTFGGNRIRLEMHKLAAHVKAFNTAAVQLARTEADAASKLVAVAGSIGPTGAMLEPHGDLKFDEAVSAFEEQACALHGVDVFWIETMSDLEEVHAAILGCHHTSADTPIVATMTFDSNGRTMMGVKPEQATKALSELGVIALGANCGNGPVEVENVIAKMRHSSSRTVLVAKANAGLPHMKGDIAIYDATPDVMADYARHVLEHGARIIGACCGSTPDHIRAIANALHQAETFIQYGKQS
jgi:5-methyltetrahydrofolate--homocysteine methyltransferase